MNTHQAYKTVLTRHQSTRMVMRPRTALGRRRRQAIIGAGISSFIVTLGFVISLNVSDPVDSRAADNGMYTAVNENASSELISAIEASSVMDSDKFSVTYSVPDETAVEISLTDNNGNIVLSAAQNAVKGTNSFESNKYFPAGIYFARIKTQNKEQIIKIVKK